MQQTEHKSFEAPDETRPFPNGRAGTEFIAGAGDVTSLPSGHDAWVVGDEPVTVVDWFGASNYVRKG